MLHLVDVREPIHDSPHELRPNARALMRRSNDKILHEDDCRTIAHDAHDPHEPIARKGTPDGKGARIPRTQPLGASDVVRPADRLVQAENLVEPGLALICGKLPHLNDVLLHRPSFARSS